MIKAKIISKDFVLGVMFTLLPIMTIYKFYFQQRTWIINVITSCATIILITGVVTFVPCFIFSLCTGWCKEDKFLFLQKMKLVVTEDIFSIMAIFALAFATGPISIAVYGSESVDSVEKMFFIVINTVGFFVMTFLTFKCAKNLYLKSVYLKKENTFIKVGEVVCKRQYFRSSLNNCRIIFDDKEHIVMLPSRDFLCRDKSVNVGDRIEIELLKFPQSAFHYMIDFKTDVKKEVIKSSQEA